MKSFLIRNAFLCFLGIGLITGCSNEELSPDTQQAISEVDVVAIDESEQIAEEIHMIIEDIYATDEILTLSRENYQSDHLPECVTVTTGVTETTRQKTIDFGEGCELRNGNTVSGSILFLYSINMELMSKELSFVLKDFTFNGVQVEGESTVTRVRDNGSGNPQSNVLSSFTLTWESGAEASLALERTREWIEGYGSGFWADNVFLITGTSVYTNRLGNVWQKTVVTPLRREMACRFLVSGELRLSRNENSMMLDYGDGTCDNKALLTRVDGTTEEINLRRFNR
ncbi:hypothetical protein [Ascidiimonas aurantiaca]|uniref:hypothetical protein n=1 Tax=Ascidiimonas aurantiaca TaxID=1685432 RepID=UPI0030ED38B3